MIDFSLRLRELRKQKHITQQQLAEQVGLTKAMISAYETASRYPSYDSLIRLASVFGVSTDYLLGLKNEQSLDISGLSEQDICVLHGLIDHFKTKNQMQ